MRSLSSFGSDRAHATGLAPLPPEKLDFLGAVSVLAARDGGGGFLCAILVNENRCFDI